MSVNASGLAASSAPGGIYNSSHVPAGLPWYTYNYCNAPHVSAAHYELPQDKDAKLIYLNVIQRHHKRTPDNLYPRENKFNPQGWECSDFRQINYGIGEGSASGVGGNSMYHLIDTPSWHPLLPLIWNGTCDAGQLTAAGLADSVQHGTDFFSVYGPQGKVPFLHDGVNEKDVYIRTSNSDRTYQVAGGLLHGMGHHGAFPVHTQPSNIDDIVPNYSCDHANALRNNYQSVSAWTDHIKNQSALFDRLNTVVGTANQSAWNTWIDHHFDALSSRQCSGHELPVNPDTGKSVSQADASAAYAEGDWEYNYIWNTADGADDYVRYGFGVFVQELARNLVSIRDGHAQHKLKYYVGHDGTIVRLLKTLAQSGQIRWPALGSEVILEVWQGSDKKHHVRILSYGRTLYSDSKALTNNGTQANWVPLEDVINYLQSRVPADLFSKCVSS